MMLPEHVELLREHQKELTKVKKPVIDEQRRAEMDELVCEAMAYVRPLVFKYFDDGRFRTVKGTIGRYDESAKTLWVKDEEESAVRLDMDRIVDIQED